MAISLISALSFSPIMQVKRISVHKSLPFTCPSHKVWFGKEEKENKWNLNPLVANSDHSSGDEKPRAAKMEEDASSDIAKPSFRRSSLTAREKLRAARVLNRYNEPNTASKPKVGNQLFDVLRESEKGKKKGLPAAPNNMLDDSKRGLPKAGLTFDFPGGSDVFLIVFSFVFISTLMFATTYVVWKMGAIHFNEY
ncbi:unnamed protein product [Cuscuta epithymum]|uniref:Differentiation-associated protein 1 n=2 Tax=Cuscuta epithymum TaxID=186058 RepID=A0AAV0EC35_9ASTE|nr:unnamed protein product [Cuscuta epithymum]